MNPKIAFLLGVVACIVALTITVYAEEIKNFFVSTETYNKLNTDAIANRRTIQDSAANALEIGLTNLEKEQMAQDSTDLQQLTIKCVKNNKVKECVTALNTVDFTVTKSGNQTG